MVRRAPGRIRTMLIFAMAIAVASCGATVTKTAPLRGTPSRVAVFGDSLAVEAQPYFTSLTRAEGGTDLIYDSIGGTAVCDWLSAMADVAARFRPTAVLLEFSGNALTSCMKGYVPGTPAYYRKYQADTERAIDIFGGEGAHVYLIGAPVSKYEQKAVPDWDELNLQYEEIALTDLRRVSYIDAGAAVEGPGGTYVQTLPCLQAEPCTGPRIDGVPSNVIRSPDGAHFCPVQHQGGQPCPVYASGAFRFASAMMHGLKG